MAYKEDMNFKNSCLYKTGKVAVSARFLSDESTTSFAMLLCCIF